MDTSKLATKSDLKSEIKGVKSEFKLVWKGMLRLEERLENVEEGQKTMDAKLDKIQNTLDKFVGGIDELRDENTVGTHHTRELQLKVDDHESRLKHLESPKTS